MGNKAETEAMNEVIEHARKELRDALSFSGGCIDGSVYSSVQWNDSVAKAVEKMIEAKVAQALLDR